MTYLKHFTLPALIALVAACNTTREPTIITDPPAGVMSTQERMDLAKTVLIDVCIPNIDNFNGMDAGLRAKGFAFEEIYDEGHYYITKNFGAAAVIFKERDGHSCGVFVNGVWGTLTEDVVLDVSLDGLPGSQPVPQDILDRSGGVIGYYRATKNRAIAVIGFAKNRVLAFGEGSMMTVATLTRKD